ncbi:unnamed protein product [Phytomonas sp. Hart1]|nr:unnamed protein product [Phytomonas sp. Hart1]|eukprot:CCW67023.1 unnamed protein product [Phytomonas sp. isolate Hart1]
MSDTLPASAKEDIKVAFVVILDVLVAVGPQIGYLFQFVNIHLAHSSSGYSPLVSLIVLGSNTIRIYYYYGYHYRLSLVIQALLSILVHLALLHKLITLNTEEQQINNRYYNGNREVVVLEGANSAFVAGYQPNLMCKEESTISTPTATLPLNHRGDDLNSNSPQCGFCYALHRLLNIVETRFNSTNLSKFWATYSLCALFGLIASVFLFDYTGYNWLSVAFVGYLALCTEALLLVPQVIRNSNEGSTEGLSPVLIFCWAGGDVLKLIYFILMKQSIPFWVCAIFQLFVDFVLLGQIIYFGWQRRVDDNVAPPQVGNNPSP